MGFNIFQDNLDDVRPSNRTSNADDAAPTVPSNYMSDADDVAPSNSSRTVGGAFQTAAGSYYVYVIDWKSYATSYCLWIVFVAGLCGNLFVLGVLVWRRSRSQLVSQILIASLAVSDIGLLISVTWVAAVGVVRPSWTFGLFGCQMSSMWRSMASSASIWTLMVIAIDR